MNVAWVGGTGLWCLDLIKSMPLWHHHVIYLHDEPEYSVVEDFTAAGAEISYAPRVTPDILDTIDPSAVILSNTNPNKIVGGHPWSWITKNYYTVYVHHSAFSPWLPGAKVEVFVSHYLENRYRNLWDRMPNRIIAPPLGSMEEFFAIDRIESDRCVIGRVSNDNRQKFPAQLRKILQEVGQPHIIVGAQKYWGNPPENGQYPPVNSRPVPHLLQDMDVFVYQTGLTETWGRCVTEAMASGLPCVVENKGGVAEQIRDGIDGFVCSSQEEFVEKLCLLTKDSALRFRMGKHARERAQCFVEQNFKAQVEPLLIKNALKGS